MESAHDEEMKADRANLIDLCCSPKIRIVTLSCKPPEPSPGAGTQVFSHLNEMAVGFCGNFVQSGTDADFSWNFYYIFS